ncbi:MAG: SLBB domain-containing protein [Candidatus Firestonebacteria bacterium]|nr:SLBB domain-containing protein [Candidatus Firestonebacteria bacterium]
MFYFKNGNTKMEKNRNYFGKKKLIYIFLICNILLFLINANAKAENYTLGIGDILDIYVWKEPDLTRTITIRPDGYISFPLIGDIKAEGITPSSLSEILKKNLSAQIKDPQLTVIVKESKSQKIYIFGEVQRPGEYFIENKIGLIASITKAGGYKENIADLSSIFVIREDKLNKNKIRKEVNLKKFLLDGDLSQDIDIETGDVIYVPKVFKKVYVLGEVRNPGVFNLEDDDGVIEAITNAGGYNIEKANMKKIVIVRKGALDKEISKLDLEKFIELGDPYQNVEIKNGDIIYVSSKSLIFDKVYVMGEVNKPGVYTLEKEMSAMEAITIAGGYNKSALLKSVMVIRKTNEPKEEDKPVVNRLDLSEIIKNGDTKSDMKLAAGDVVYVPERFIAKVGDFVDFFFKNINPVLDTYIKAYEASRIQDRYNYYKKQ